MWIKTEKVGSLIPVSSVEALKPNAKGGTQIMLKSGKRVLDSRSPAKILEQAVSVLPQDTEIVRIASNIFQEFAKMKDQIVTLTQTMDSKHNALYDAVNKSSQHVSREATNARERVLQATSKLADETVTLVTNNRKVARETLALGQVRESLEEAVIECLNDTEKDAKSQNF